jgi:CheY-like chemotaxis protein
MTKVLLVDDDEEFREAMDAALRQQGFVIEHAASGREALSVLARSRPDAILLDLMMPVMDGWQFLAALARDSQLGVGAVPIAVLSAARDPQGLPPQVVLLPKPCTLKAVLDFLALGSR